MVAVLAIVFAMAPHAAAAPGVQNPDVQPSNIQRSNIQQCARSTAPGHADLQDPASAGGNTASVTCFVDAVGVNNHMAWSGSDYDRPALVLEQLRYLGVRHVRDMIDGNPWNFGELAREGVVFDTGFFNTDEEISQELPPFVAALDTLVTRYPNAVALFEGPNEPNCQRAYYEGKSTTASAAATVAAQRAIYEAIKADPHLAGVAVPAIALNLSCKSLGGPDAYVASEEALSAFADMGNAHVYSVRQPPRRVLLSPRLGIPIAQAAVPNKPVVITEFGYTTPAWVSEETAARLTLFGLADAFKEGVVRTDIYELMDDHTGDGETEHNFGLFHSDGTPKPAATAIHDLTTILRSSPREPAAQLPMPVLSGLPQGVACLALADGAGGFALLLWDEEGDGANASVDIWFRTTTVLERLYNPLRGTAPIESQAGVSRVRVRLGPDLLVMRVIPQTVEEQVRPPERAD